MLKLLVETKKKTPHNCEAFFITIFFEKLIKPILLQLYLQLLEIL